MKILCAHGESECQKDEIVVLDNCCLNNCNCTCKEKFVGIYSDKTTKDAVVFEYDNRFGEVPDRRDKTVNALAVMLTKEIVKNNPKLNLHLVAKDNVLPLLKEIQSLRHGTVINIEKTNVNDCVKVTVKVISEPKEEVKKEESKRKTKKKGLIK